MRLSTEVRLFVCFVYSISLKTMTMIVPITFSALLSFRIKFLKPYTFFEPFLSHCNETVITLACASPPSPVGVLFPVKAPKLTAFHPLCEVSKTRASILGQSSIKEWHPTLPLRQQVAKSEYSESLREVFDGGRIFSFFRGGEGRGKGCGSFYYSFFLFRFPFPKILIQQQKK